MNAVDLAATFVTPAQPTPTFAVPRRAPWITTADDDEWVSCGDEPAAALESHNRPSTVLTTPELASQRDRRVAGLLGTHASGSYRGGSRHRTAATIGTTVSAAPGGARGSKPSVEAMADIARHHEIATLILNGMTTPKALARHLENTGRALSQRQIARITDSDGFAEIFNKMLERKFARLNEEMADESANPYKRMHAAEVRAMTLLVESLEELRANVGGETKVVVPDPTTGVVGPARPKRAPTPAELSVAVGTATRILKMGPNAGRYQRVDETQIATFVPTPEQARVLLEADDESFSTFDSEGNPITTRDDHSDMVDIMRQNVGSGIAGGMRATRTTHRESQEQADAQAALDATVERHRAAQPQVVDV